MRVLSRLFCATLAGLTWLAAINRRDLGPFFERQPVRLTLPMVPVDSGLPSPPAVKGSPMRVLQSPARWAHLSQILVSSKLGKADR